MALALQKLFFTQAPSLVLLVDKLGLVRLGRFRLLLVAKVPVVQVTSSRTQVSSEAEPANVWSKRPSCDLVNLAPDVCHITGEACQRYNIYGGFDRTLKAEEQRHPDEIQAELDGVESGTLL